MENQGILHARGRFPLEGILCSEKKKTDSRAVNSFVIFNVYISIVKKLAFLSFFERSIVPFQYDREGEIAYRQKCSSRAFHN